jgi:hypothetical protein
MDRVHQEEHGDAFQLTTLYSFVVPAISTRLYFILCYNGRKISASLAYFTVRGEKEIERARWEHDALCAIGSPLSPHLGWLADSEREFCNGQQSSEISCDECS